MFGLCVVVGERHLHVSPASSFCSCPGLAREVGAFACRASSHVTPACNFGRRRYTGFSIFLLFLSAHSPSQESIAERAWFWLLPAVV